MEHLHPKLIDLGILRYAEAQRQRGEERLFPTLQVGSTGYYSDRPSKDFAAYLKGINVKSDKTSFHSFRHGFKDACRCGGVQPDTPGFSTICRRQRTLSVNLPIAARKARCDASGARSISVSTNEGWKSERSRSRPGAPGMRRCNHIHSTGSRAISRSAARPRTVHATHAGVTMPSTARQYMFSCTRGAERGAAAVIAPGSHERLGTPATTGAIARTDALRTSGYRGRALWRNCSGCRRRSTRRAKIARGIPLEIPSRPVDALPETTAPEADGARRRQPGYRGSGARCDPERLHRPWQPSHASRGIIRSGNGGNRSSAVLRSGVGRKRRHHCQDDRLHLPGLSKVSDFIED